MMKWATLCYVRQGGQTLMLHRIKRAVDMHAGKWNGLGGKFMPGETPEACVIREVEEESGLRLRRPTLRGLLTFPKFNNDEDWYAFVFVAHEFSGRLIDSDEGVLRWIDNDKLLELNLWDGDRVFIPWLDQPGFFSARFDYAQGQYVGHDVQFYGAPPAAIAPDRGTAPDGVAQGRYVSDMQLGPRGDGPTPAPVGYRAEDDTTCWLCGGPVFKHHCKITCTVCGFRRDCSDP
ncbi:MAG: 8-oxo-dGTP diphosphatase [Litorilinea sp.]